MAVSFVLSNAGRTAAANAYDTGLAGGSIKLYSVTDTLLAVVPLKATNIGTVSNGVVTIDCSNTTTTGEAGAGAGTNATYGTLCTSGGTVWGTANAGVGSGYSINLVNASIASGQTVTITSGTITVPAGT